MSFYHKTIKPIRLSNTDYHELYHVFQNSSLFISGRWHASIIALLSSTPIILYGADSHKTRALYSIIDYDYPFFETQTLPIHLDDVIDCCKSILEDKTLRNRIELKVQKASLES